MTFLFQPTCLSSAVVAFNLKDTVEGVVRQPAEAVWESGIYKSIRPRDSETLWAWGPFQSLSRKTAFKTMHKGPWNLRLVNLAFNLSFSFWCRPLLSLGFYHSVKHNHFCLIPFFLFSHCLLQQGNQLHQWIKLPKSNYFISLHACSHTFSCSFQLETLPTSDGSTKNIRFGSFAFTQFSFIISWIFVKRKDAMV